MMKLTPAFLVLSSLFSHSDAFVSKGLPSFTFREYGKPFTALEVSAETTTSAPATGTSPQTTVASVPKVAQRWRKSTKQLVTLGPASSNREMIEKLFLAGADVFRLNFSHGSQEQKKELLKTIREVEEKYAHPIGILGDLQGPKLRVSKLSITVSTQHRNLTRCMIGWRILESNWRNASGRSNFSFRLRRSTRG